MIITAVGLGLIGGSMCKAIKKHTNHTVYGIDVNKETIAMAVSQNAIDSETDDLGLSDITIVSLYPTDAIDYITANADKFKEGSIVIDTCGIKKAVVDSITPLLEKYGVTFIGAHPMAGREFSGFEYFSTRQALLLPPRIRYLRLSSIFWRTSPILCTLKRWSLRLPRSTTKSLRSPASSPMWFPTPI